MGDRQHGIPKLDWLAMIRVSAENAAALSDQRFIYALRNRCLENQLFSIQHPVQPRYVCKKNSASNLKSSGNHKGRASS